MALRAARLASAAAALAAALAGEAAPAGTSGSGSGGGSGRGSGSGSTAPAQRSNGKCAVALALQGGGFRAVAVDTGFVAGMLAFVGQQQQQQQQQQQNASAPTLHGTGLLDRICLLSSNSGSSWFTAELVYSSHFLSLAEGMAASPSTAAAQYEANWTNLWLKATQVLPPDYDKWAQRARDIVRELLGTGDEDTIFMVQYFLASGFTWNAFTDLLLGSTGDLRSDVLLGSTVGKWAEGKIWQPVHSAVFPPSSPPGIFIEGDPLAIPKVSYSTVASSPLPVYLPASFSVELGAGLNATAPLRYIASSALENFTELSYEAHFSLWPLRTSGTSGALGEDLSRGSIQNFAGRLPVLDVAAASSAFLGSHCVMGAFYGEAEELVHADLTPWISDAPLGLATAKAKEIVGDFSHRFGINRRSVHALAAGGVRGIIDGGFTDGTGIGQAVAAGATEVVAVLNGNATADPFYVEMLFPGGPRPSNLGQPSELYPLFQSPPASVVGAAFSAFPRLNVTSSMITFMKVFAVGTIRAVTAENKHFGLEAGRSVLIHIINIGSDLNIGPFTNLNNFDVLAQEIEAALLDPTNAAFVKTTLVPMLMGKSAEEEPESIVI